MKKYLLGIAVIVLISSCDVTIIDEHPYDPRNNFLGRYEAEEYSETLGVYTYFNLRIVKDADPRSRVIYLQNFYGENMEVYAEVYGDRIIIPRQVNGYYIIEGSGNLDFGDLVLDYIVEDTYPGNRFVNYLQTISYRR